MLNTLVIELLANIRQESTAEIIVNFKHVYISIILYFITFYLNVECQGYKYIRNRRFLRKVAKTETDEEDDDGLNTNPPEKDQSEETVTPTNANREQTPSSLRPAYK